MTVQNARSEIYWQMDELTPLMKFFWLELIIGLFHLQMNTFNIQFDKLWDVFSDVVFLNHYSNILKHQYINQNAANFHHCNDFFRTVIETLVIILCMHKASCKTMTGLESKINKSDWHNLISKIKYSYFEIFKI